MIKRAKINKNLIIILNAIFGVVFAFMVGVTYAFQSSTLTYGTKINSASAYMTNQQLEVVNDTLENPIPFGIGGNNHEISVQYSIGYDFDIMFEYSLSWSGGPSVSTNNVILNFSDRDNFIVDDQYIYYASKTDGMPSGIKAGNGKLTVIVGVDFVDTEDLTYNGQSLTINMTAKIYKVQSSYSTGSVLYVEGSKAADAWLQYKNCSSLGVSESSAAYVMVYNYRYCYDQGIPYVGPRTAYRREILDELDEDGKNNKKNTSWLGGNKAYAGTGIYVITGAQSVELSVSVKGVWRNGSSDEASTLVANSIQYNYTEKNSENKTQWVHMFYDDQLVFETRNYNYPIPPNTTCYIQILDSIEINSIFKTPETYDDEYDISRVVTNKIEVNGSEFIYDSKNDDSSEAGDDSERDTKGLVCGFIANTEATSQTVTYSKPAVEVINTSKYQNGLFVNSYDTSTNKPTQEFKASFTFINNTADYKTVTLTNGLKSFVGNAKTFVKEDGSTTKPTSFQSSAYYEDVQLVSSSYYSISIKATSFTLAPYGSLNFVVTYEANSAFYGWLKTTYSNGLDTIMYDAWLQVEPSISVGAESQSKNLIVESDMDVSGSNSILTLSVKNASTKVVTGLTASISLFKNSYVISNAFVVDVNDWDASYWKYFDADGNRAKYGEAFIANKWRLQTHEYSQIALTVSNVGVVSEEYTVGVSGNLCTITNSSLVIQPNETIQIAVITVATSEQIVVDASAIGTATSNPAGVMLVNSGKESAYIINSSSDNYYVRFTGTLDANFDMTKFALQNGYYYYLDIVRANQIISLDMTSVGTLEFVKFTSQGWTNDISKIVELFSA